LSVSFEKTEFALPPARFEAGTPPIADAIALGAAIDFLNGLDRVAIAEHEAGLLESATARLGTIKGVKLYGTARPKAAIVSFTMDGVHPHDVGTVLDHEGIAVRVGHHCAQPVMDRFGVPGTVRASFGLYNTQGEVEALARGLEKVREIFG
jgi:cysteine desulfurase/selenocysteine lyase